MTSKPPLPGDFLSLQHVQPFVLDDGASRSLHFTSGELQSRMRLDSPCGLELDYTRTMMGFLLFNPVPGHIGMIGLGGGSIAKFCHRFLPASRMTVLEINPHVIPLRAAFQVPPDDERFEVLAADGALYLQTRVPQYAVLLVDGFDPDGQPAGLCSQRFYDDCLAALPEGGVLVVNLHYDHPDYGLLFERIRRSFGGNAVEIVTLEKSNSIVFARKGASISPQALNLADSLAALDARARAILKPELARMLWQMKNPGTGDGR
ncbi:Spermidine synthase-like protein [Polaromonas sp. CG9_12]|nr:Spermidine synthase-like protein [Polaromonas sp. CG9_12]